MAGRFKALTCAQEPRCSRQDNPALAACPQGFLSSAMAVPHNDRRPRNAAASPVLALLAASKALMDVAVGIGVGAALRTAAGGATAVPSSGPAAVPGAAPCCVAAGVGGAAAG